MGCFMSVMDATCSVCCGVELGGTGPADMVIGPPFDVRHVLHIGEEEAAAALAGGLEGVHAPEDLVRWRPRRRRVIFELGGEESDEEGNDDENDEDDDNNNDDDDQDRSVSILSL